MTRLALAVVLALATPAAAGAQVVGGGRPGGPPAPPPPPATVAPTFVEGTGAISGLVVDSVTGSPIAEAVVYLTLSGRPAGPQPRQFTDARGRFAFASLPAGKDYAVSVSKPGYLLGGYSSVPLPGAHGGLIELDDGEWHSTVRLALSRTSAISGTVTDEAGEAVVGVPITVLRQIHIAGRVEWASNPLTSTDDRGAYRIAGLPQGRYVVFVPSIQAAVPTSTSFSGRAADVPPAAFDTTPMTRLVVGPYPMPPPPRSGVPFAYPPTFAPSSALVAEATLVDLKPGEDRTGANVRLEAVPTGRLAGQVEGPPEAFVRLTLRLLAPGLEGLGNGSEAATTLVGADGRFEFVNVPAGTYTLDSPLSLTEFTTAAAMGGGIRGPGRGSGGPAPPPGTGGWGSSSRDIEGAPAGTALTQVNFRSGAPAFAARMTVAVSGGRDTAIVVPLRALGTMSGRIVIEPPATAAPGATTPSFPGVTLEPATGDPSLGLPQQGSSAKPDGTFAITGVRAGLYNLRILGSSRFMVKSATSRGRDYADEPFDTSQSADFDDLLVTVTTDVPVLTGSVRDDRGQASDAAVVIAFPVEPARWTNYGWTPRRIKTARTSRTGLYRFASLPAGDYHLIAVPPELAKAWQDPAFLKAAAATAARISLTWGGQATRELTIRR